MGVIAVHASSGYAAALYSTVPPSLMATWGYSAEVISAGGNPIAHAEAAVVLFTMWQLRRLLRGKQVLWFVDNTVALHSFVKGISKNAAISRTVEAVHILSFRLECSVWYEYVASADNWADGISREGNSDPFTQSLSLQADTLLVSESWWENDLAQIWAAHI